MITSELRLHELGLLARTRGLLGAGIGILVADRLSDTRRKDTGWILLAIGVPGISGIGAVGAARLLNRYGPIEAFPPECSARTTRRCCFSSG